jgi:hypothetical protein
MFGERGDIVSDQNAPLPRGPVENSRVVGSKKSRVLHAEKIESGPSAEQSPHDVVVEVLVDGQRDHSAGPVDVRMACDEAVADALRVKSPFILAAHGVVSSGAIRQVGRDFRLVLEKIADDRVNIRQGKRRILLSDLFRGRSAAKSFDEGVKSNASATNADDPVLIRRERHRLGLFNGQTHGVQYPAA